MATGTHQQAHESIAQIGTSLISELIGEPLPRHLQEEGQTGKQNRKENFLTRAPHAVTGDETLGRRTRSSSTQD